MSHNLNNHNHYAAAEAHARSEPELRQLIVQSLRASGIAVVEQVVCAAGTADLVTADRTVIYEVKLYLTRKKLLAACGQIQLYRACINPAARAVIVGMATRETAALIPHLRELGIEVVVWNDMASNEGQEAEIKDVSSEASPSASGPQLPILRWNVATLATTCGISNPAQLARAIGLGGGQGLYRVWYGTGQNISLAMLARLGRYLGPSDAVGVNPGGWFCWSNSALRWNIPMMATRVGLATPVSLAFASHIHTNSAYSLWRDESQFVMLKTLAKLAHALSSAEYPFDTGDLFTFEAEEGDADTGLLGESLS